MNKKVQRPHAGTHVEMPHLPKWTPDTVPRLSHPKHGRRSITFGVQPAVFYNVIPAIPTSSWRLKYIFLQVLPFKITWPSANAPEHSRMATIEKSVWNGFPRQHPKTDSLQDKQRARASLAPNIIVDYSLVVPAWGAKAWAADDFVEEWLGPNHLGVKALATQHLLGVPYFKSVTEREIVVEWQQMASHGRKVVGEDFASPMCKIGESSDGRSWMEQTFVKVEGNWRISIIKPEVLYHTGDFRHIRRPDEDEGSEAIEEKKKE